MNRKISIFVAAALGIVAVIAGMLLARAVFEPPAPAEISLQTGTLLEPTRPLPQFALVDHEELSFGNDRLRGRWSLMFFGFTNCPDVCPMTLRLLAQTSKSLADLPPPQQPRIVLVSVDPQRDRPEQLATYVRFFDAAFVGVTGEPKQIERFTRELGVPVATTPTENGAYTVDHSAAIFLIDPDGAIRALFSPPHSPAAIASDYRRIVDAFGGDRR